MPETRFTDAEIEEVAETYASADPDVDQDVDLHHKNAAMLRQLLADNVLLRKERKAWRARNSLLCENTVAAEMAIDDACAATDAAGIDVEGGR